MHKIMGFWALADGFVPLFYVLLESSSFDDTWDYLTVCRWVALEGRPLFNEKGIGCLPSTRGHS